MKRIPLCSWKSCASHTHTLTRTELERSTSRSFSISMHASCSVWTGLFHRFRFPPFFWCVAFNEICCSIAARCSAKPPPKFRHKTTRFRLHFEDLFFPTLFVGTVAQLSIPPHCSNVCPSCSRLRRREGTGGEGGSGVGGRGYILAFPPFLL